MIYFGIKISKQCFLNRSLHSERSVTAALLPHSNTKGGETRITTQVILSRLGFLKATRPVDPLREIPLWCRSVINIKESPFGSSNVFVAGLL